ncbi:hypothetical protein Brms1b_001510 [Colletotrichum noveboracense]|nr:hypothetical protein COL940_011121 [Colletotrichum noveboracense]KAJ0323630.1 hypothetical protein Brms1b_001510 [Colletotrichum noveboracense]
MSTSQVLVLRSTVRPEHQATMSVELAVLTNAHGAELTKAKESLVGGMKLFEPLIWVLVGPQPHGQFVVRALLAVVVALVARGKPGRAELDVAIDDALFESHIVEPFQLPRLYVILKRTRKVQLKGAFPRKLGRDDELIM